MCFAPLCWIEWGRSMYMKPIYYFAYGSNMDMEQMRRRCPDAKCIDTAAGT